MADEQNWVGDRRVGRKRLRLRPSIFSPPLLDPLPAPANTATFTVLAQRAIVTLRRSQRRPSVFAPTTVLPDAAPPVIPPVGPTPLATFTAIAEAGARVTYQWRTDIRQEWSGLEQRISLLARPRERYEFAAHLTDAEQRSIMAELADRGADGAPFAVALPYEELVAVGGVGAAIEVPSLAHCDWVVPGQRALVVRSDGATADATVQTAVGTTITLDALPAGFAVSGSRIMPLVIVYLDPTQQLSRYAVNAGRWTLSAFAARFRYGASTATPGAGATLTMHGGYPVWDRGIAARQASQPMHGGYDVQDMGLSMKPLFVWSQPQWSRAIRIERGHVAEWQWLKLFLWTVRGRGKAFLLPSGRPDLVPLSDASGSTLLVSSDARYVDAWASSWAHARVALVGVDGTVGYRDVTNAIDNGDGTQTLTLSTAFAGALARVEFLELCRLESDDVTVTWHSFTFACEISARVVQR